MANSHLRRPAAGSTIKGISKSTRWSSLAMLGAEEDDRVYLRKNVQDCLSSLPDDLLLNIAERLNIADAARTSILSRRWRRIPAMLSRIRITVDSIDPEHDRTREGVAQANAAVLSATMSLLRSRPASPYSIRLLCVQFFLGHGSIRIGQTVANTIATQKVQSTELTILPEKETERCTTVDLLTNGRELNLFAKYCSLSGITRLKLENVWLPESDFPTIFGLCKQLEFLRLDNCYMFVSLLHVEHLQLRELEIFRSSFERVDLNCLPELTTLTFSGWVSQNDPLSFGHVPLLHTVTISNTALSSHKMLKLSKFLATATISNLHLNFRSEKIWVKPQGPIELSQVFHKLRLVNLADISEECDLTWTMFVLQSAPSLEELCIRVCDLCQRIRDKKKRKMLAYSEKRKDAGAKWESSASDLKHHNLSVLRITGFQAEDKFLNYVTTVMESAVNLKHIYLYEKPVCEKCMYNHWRRDRYPRTKRQRILVSNSFSIDTRPHLTLHFPSLRKQCYGSVG